MKIKTDRFGEVEFDESIIIKFDEGIIGFESMTDYILITEGDSLFSWLTSVDEPEIMFPLFPAILMDEKFPTVENHEVYGIVRLAKEIPNITINLKAPIYLNLTSKSGYQKIIDNDNYEVAKQLFVENKE